jgi:transcription elongation GreA/GreB family factor
MSRAFVKESDDVAELPDRPVSEHPNVITKRGLAQIEAAVAKHRAALADAQASEDRTAIAAASRELRYWTQRRASAELQSPPQDCDSVRFGCRVTISRDGGPDSKGAREQTFTIVGEDEADPTTGTLSYVAPLAHALIGKEVGDVVKVGSGEAEIVRIERGGE